MSESFSAGDRVKHPKMTDWGMGQIISVESSKATIFFETVGEKIIKTDLISLRLVDGVDAESAVLDSKFKKRGRKSRPFVGSQYFNDGKSANRKQFIESLGGRCANWNWSWSFVNSDERKVFFGAWHDHIQGNRALILSASWEYRDDRKTNGWPEAMNNLQLVENEEHSLHVYTMILDPASEGDFEKGPRKIGAILNDLTEATLIREDDEWYAVFPENIKVGMS